jgi:methionyl-tRNA formyltransferase
MQMESGLDTGPVLARASCPINIDDTAQTLHDRLAILGADTLLAVLPNIVELQSKAQAQNNELTCYAAKLLKPEAEIDWQQSADQLVRQIQAFNPWPVAQTNWQNQVFRIWSASLISEKSSVTPGGIITVNKDSIDVATGDGILRLNQIQLPGKRAMPVADFLNANTIKAGEHFG